MNEVQSSNETKPTTFKLILRSLPGSWRTDPEMRLRHALKVMLRSFGLRCESVEQVNENDHNQKA